MGVDGAVRTVSPYRSSSCSGTSGESDGLFPASTTGGDAKRIREGAVDGAVEPISSVRGATCGEAMASAVLCAGKGPLGTISSISSSGSSITAGGDGSGEGDLRIESGI